jgi:hypothetical protein
MALVFCEQQKDQINFMLLQNALVKASKMNCTVLIQMLFVNGQDVSSQKNYTGEGINSDNSYTSTFG